MTRPMGEAGEAKRVQFDPIMVIFQDAPPILKALGLELVVLPKEHGQP